MKVVILAGGLGTRLSEYTKTIPKPMVKVGGKPILFHIMKLYANHGFKDFNIALGYKGNVIKKFFNKKFFDWKINLIDTGQGTMTGGRIKRIAKYLDGENNFCLTYGDGVSDVNIKSLIKFHKSHGKQATLTATYPPGRFGALNIVNDQVIKFEEKPRGDGALINGGFFVLSTKVLNRINPSKGY